MKKTYIFACAIALAACSQQDELVQTEESSVVELGQSKEVVFKEKGTSTYKDVVNYLYFAGNKGLKTRSMEEAMTLPQPYLIDGDTVAWVVNHEEGWELLSNDRRAPLVLAHSDEGSFSLNTDNEAYLAFMNEMLRRQSLLHKTSFSENDTIHSDWRVYYLPVDSVRPEEIIHNRKVTRLPQDPDDGEEHNGYWALITVQETITVNTPHQHEITTHWHQHMNTYIPNRWLVGCGGVAVAQYLYYLYTKYGQPSSIVDSCQYNSATNKYVYSGNSNSIWTGIAAGDTLSRDLLLGYVAESLQTTYGANSSSTHTFRYPMFLNQFGYSFTEDLYSSNSIISILQTHGAVLATGEAYIPKNGGYAGHAYIIDRWQEATSDRRAIYGWVETDVNGNPLVEFTDPSDETLYEYIVYRNLGHATIWQIGMNWGWGGANDDNLYDKDALSFPTQNYTFDYNLEVIH